MTKKNDEQFSEAEAEKRLRAALRGSRVTGHKPMADIPKRATKKAKTKNKRNAGD